MGIAILSREDLIRERNRQLGEAVVVDARRHTQFLRGHIPGAVWLGWEAWCEPAPSQSGPTLAQEGYWRVLDPRGTRAPYGANWRIRVEHNSEERRSHREVAMDPEGNETRVLHDLVNFCGKDVIEIGCGDGRMTRRYADQTRSVLGVDTNTGAIEHAIQMTSDALKSRVTFRVGDSARMTLPPASFDTAILSWSL